MQTGTYAIKKPFSPNSNQAVDLFVCFPTEKKDMFCTFLKIDGGHSDP